MSEKRLFIQSGDLQLEALLEELPGQKGVVVTHPHPLYGGEMRNPVVETVVRAYREKGFTTLRFNFRGAGGSQGSHDQGRGEQEDVQAGLLFLSSLGKTEIDLAGYSFGAWVNAQGIERFALARRFVLVSPPVAFLDFGFLAQSPKIRLVVAGSEDEIGPAAAIEDQMSKWNPEGSLRIIQGADHFYSMKMGELRSALLEFLDVGFK
jgi:uncharacterized protein